MNADVTAQLTDLSPLELVSLNLTFDPGHLFLQLLPCCLELLPLQQETLLGLLQSPVQGQIPPTLLEAQLHLAVSRWERFWSRAEKIRTSLED